MTEMTRTHRFRYNIGDTIRMRNLADTGFRYHIVGHDYRRAAFGYLILHNDEHDIRPLFYEAQHVEADWQYMQVTDPT